MSQNFVEYFGYLSLLAISAKFGLFFASWISRRFLKSPLDVRKCGGDWALVTGSTDGIGKSYAFALAKKGLNIILVSRSPYKLQNVAAELEQKYSGIKTKIIEVDFAKEDPSTYIPKIEDSIKDLDIGVLVNNVGISYEHPAEFLELDSTYVDTLVNVNITSLNVMTRIVLPQMAQRQKGAIINISSFSASIPTPLLSVYSATKAYVDLLSQGLAKEYLSKGITVQCILPGHVVSKLSKIRRASINVPTSDVFVKSALGRLGIDTRTTGFWAHDVMDYVTQLPPTDFLVYFVYKQMKGLRARALKKKQKEN